MNPELELCSPPQSQPTVVGKKQRIRPGNGLKLYIASSFSNLPKVQNIAAALESAGHSIPCKWWERVYQYDHEKTHTQGLKENHMEFTPRMFYSRPEVYETYLSDFMGVKHADALVFVATEEPRKYNGATVELGIALGDMKPCYLIGELETSVLYHPLRRCKDLDTLLWELDRYSRLTLLDHEPPEKEVTQ